MGGPPAPPTGGRWRKPWVKSYSFSTDYGADRFLLSFPYSNYQLKCHLLLNHHQPEQPPDFIFEDPFFSDNIEELETKVPSLVKWNPKKPEALLNVAAELLEWYKDHHVQLLQEELPDFYDEYVSLISEMNPQNIEPYVYWKDTRSPQVSP